MQLAPGKSSHPFPGLRFWLFDTKFLDILSTATALLSSLTLSSAFTFTFESYLPDEPERRRIYFDPVGNCKGNSATICLNTLTGPDGPYEDSLCAPKYEGQNGARILYITTEVGVFDGGEFFGTATLSVDRDSGDISFQQTNGNGQVDQTSYVASGSANNDGCDIRGASKDRYCFRTKPSSSKHTSRSQELWRNVSGMRGAGDPSKSSKVILDLS